MGRGKRFVVAAALVATSMPGGARGEDEVPGFDGTTYRPPADGQALFATESTGVARRASLSAGVAMAYALRPARLPPGPAPIEHALAFTGYGVIGLGFRSQVALTLPLVLRLAGASGLGENVVTGNEPPTVAMGDARILGKTSFLSAADGGPGLALRAWLSIPLGSPRSFAGDGSLTAGADLLAEYSWMVAGFRGELGFKGRSEPETWPVGGTTRFGHEIPWAAATWVRPRALGAFGEWIDKGDRQTWELAFRGSLPAGPIAPFQTGSSPLAPVLLSVASRVALGKTRQAFLVAAVDVGLTDAWMAPPLRVALVLGWAPGAPDRDGDGVPDAEDQCPELPGARGGNLEDRGCPRDDEAPGS